MSIEHVLNNLSNAINIGHFLEEMVSEKLFSTIERMTQNQQKLSFPMMQWETMIWDVCRSFEHKELWFAPKQWIYSNLENSSDEFFNISQSYAFFKLAHHDKESHYNADDNFMTNSSNRLPTSSFFNHDNGYITIQFILNYELIDQLIDKNTNISKADFDLKRYQARRKWNSFRARTLMQYQDLKKCGFELDDYSTFWALKIEPLNSDLFMCEYNQGLLYHSLEPILCAIKRINENFNIFDEMQKKAEEYYLEIEKG